MQVGNHRKIVFYKSYFAEFFQKLRQRSKDKILWTLRLIEEQKLVPLQYLKHIEGTEGLYAIRVQFGRDQYRIFCFFDDDKLIILANGFHKKSQKTPRLEIEKALRIKNEYESE